jgi:hypothetical protein
MNGKGESRGQGERVRERGWRRAPTRPGSHLSNLSSATNGLWETQHRRKPKRYLVTLWLGLASGLEWQGLRLGVTLPLGSCRRVGACEAIRIDQARLVQIRQCGFCLLLRVGDGWSLNLGVI